MCFISILNAKYIVRIRIADITNDSISTTDFDSFNSEVYFLLKNNFVINPNTSIETPITVMIIPILFNKFSSINFLKSDFCFGPLDMSLVTCFEVSFRNLGLGLTITIN